MVGVGECFTVATEDGLVAVWIRRGVACHLVSLVGDGDCSFVGFLALLCSSRRLRHR